jgi:hypothetical protein
MSEPVTLENFEEWKHHPITKRVMKLLRADRESMKEGLINNAYEDEAEVKGRCRAIAVLLDLDYYDIVEQVK